MMKSPKDAYFYTPAWQYKTDDKSQDLPNILNIILITRTEIDKGLNQNTKYQATADRWEHNTGWESEKEKESK